MHVQARPDNFVFCHIHLWSCLFTQLVALIPESEADDEDDEAAARLLLVAMDGKAQLQLSEYSPHFVKSRVHAAVRKLPYFYLLLGACVVVCAFACVHVYACVGTRLAICSCVCVLQLCS